MDTRQMFGRWKIYTDEEYITAENVVDVLRKAQLLHSQNQNEIQYLWDYYRGKTPVLGKVREVRPSINHKICVNRAAEIVTFKKGYGFGEPIQYIRRGQDESLTEDINALNEYMFSAGKQALDSELAEWLYVCGLGMRMALPGTDADEPFRLFTLDPRYSYIVCYNGLGEPQVMGVKFILKENMLPVYSVYTENMYFEIENETIIKAEPHVLGGVPLFEYPANLARTGAFEIALPLLDALNEAESNRMDDLVQFVNSFLALLGGSIDEETAQKLDEYKMLCLPEGVDSALFQPLKIGSIEIKNRFMMCPMEGTTIIGWLKGKGFVKETQDFYIERAKDGIGLMIPGCTPLKSVVGGKWLWKNPKVFEPIKPFMDELHKYDAKLFLQISAGWGRSFILGGIFQKAIDNKLFALSAGNINTCCVLVCHS